MRFGDDGDLYCAYVDIGWPDTHEVLIVIDMIRGEGMEPSPVFRHKYDDAYAFAGWICKLFDKG